MFEDLIKEKKKKPNYDKPGCWCCKFAPTYAMYPNAIYCQRFSKYQKANDGEKCKEYRERIK